MKEDIQVKNHMLVPIVTNNLKKGMISRDMKWSIQVKSHVASKLVHD